MNKFEKLLTFIFNELPVLEFNLVEKIGKEGIYRNGRIYLDNSLNITEKRAVLAEEYGHHKRTVGNIIDYEEKGAWKEEWRARRYGIEILITLDDLLECAVNECFTKYDCAEYLDVPLEFLEDALIHYSNKYDVYHNYKGYRFTFNTDSIFVKTLSSIK